MEQSRHKTAQLYTAFFLFFFIYAYQANAQVSLEIEHLGEASYKDSDGNKTGGKSSATMTNFDAKVPVSYRLDENQKPRIWIALLDTKFTSLHNENIPSEVSVKEIFNLHFGIGHIRNVKENQTLMLGLIFSVYSSHMDVTRLGLQNMFYNAAGAYIWDIHKNLKLGMGGVVTMFYGYPLPIPFPYVEWKWGDKYKLNLQFISSPDLKVSMIPRKNFTLTFLHSFRGATAVETFNGKRMMFNHRYLVAALKFGYRYKKIDFTTDFGINYNRKIKYHRRNLSSMFKSTGTNFDPTPYVSVGIKYNLF